MVVNGTVGEDPDTPGLLPYGIDPGTVTIPQYRFNKNKATHTHKIVTQGGKGVIIYPQWPLKRLFANVSKLPGLFLRIPPPRFSVVGHHPGRVEPRCNHAVQLLALVFQVSVPPASTAPQVPKADSRNAWRPQRWTRESWSKWFSHARR